MERRVKALWIVGAMSYVFATSDGVYFPLRLIAIFGLIVSATVLLATGLGKLTK